MSGTIFETELVTLEDSELDQVTGGLSITGDNAANSFNKVQAGDNATNSFNPSNSFNY